MSNKTFTIDDADKAYDVSEFKRKSLKVNQIYKWRVLTAKAQASKAGKPMLVLEVAPVTESGSVLKQFTQKVFTSIPVKSLSEKAYPIIQRRYFSTLQSLAAPAFNAFKEIIEKDDGTVFIGHDGTELDRDGRTEAQNAAKAKMMDARETVLDYIEPGQEAFAALLPREDSDYPQVGDFRQSVPQDSELPYADNVADMLG